MRIPSITANGSCVVAKIPRNFAIDAPMPPTSEGILTVVIVIALETYAKDELSSLEF